jgi:hypothetical protein
LHAGLQQVLAPGLARPTRNFARACSIRDDKYASRRLSRLEIADKQKAWHDVGDMLIARGLAFPYKGGRRNDTWCSCLRNGQCPAGFLGGS